MRWQFVLLIGVLVRAGHCSAAYTRRWRFSFVCLSPFIAMLSKKKKIKTQRFHENVGHIFHSGWCTPTLWATASSGGGSLASMSSFDTGWIFLSFLPVLRFLISMIPLSFLSPPLFRLYRVLLSSNSWTLFWRVPRTAPHNSTYWALSPNAGAPFFLAACRRTFAFQLFRHAVNQFFYFVYKICFYFTFRHQSMKWGAIVMPVGGHYTVDVADNDWQNIYWK